MKQRCTNPNHAYHKSYEGMLCDEWQDFEIFLADMGVRPEGTSLDRIDNNKGYCKANCRWATQSEQVINQQTKPHSTPYKNISVTRYGTYKVKFVRKGKYINVGSYKTIEEAVEARDSWLANN